MWISSYDNWKCTEPEHAVSCSACDDTEACGDCGGEGCPECEMTGVCYFCNPIKYKLALEAMEGDEDHGKNGD